MLSKATVPVFFVFQIHDGIRIGGGRVTGGLYVTAVNEPGDFELLKLHQRHRQLPMSEGDREATLRKKPCCRARA
jgi:hypothetical protein